MFGLGLTLICFGFAGIGGMGAYYLMDNRNKGIESRKIYSVMNKIEQLLREYEMQQEFKPEQFEEASPEEVIEESNVIDINDVFKEFEGEEK